MLLFHCIIFKLRHKAFNSTQARDELADSATDHPDLLSLAYSKRSEVLEQQVFSRAAFALLTVQTHLPSNSPK